MRMVTSAPPRTAIIGGMGPLASAEFVNTIYEYSACRVEQEAPSLVLWSDPSFPDRTAALFDGQTELLTARLHDAVQRCCQAGAEQIIVCCMTAHAVVPHLPGPSRTRILSLVEVLLSTAIVQRRRLLLLASTGTRRAGVLEQHRLWPDASRWLFWPDSRDQERVHRAIYAIKRNRGLAAAVTLVEGLVRKYSAESFAAGCTELHLLHKRWGSRPPRCVDPLDILAARIAAPSAVAPTRNATVASAR